MLALYRLLGGVGLPAVRAYLWLRRRRGKEDGTRFRERLGEANRPRPPGPLIWTHAASVGESLSVIPLIERLLGSRPGAHVLVTTGTVTSARMIGERLPARAFHQYAPIDVRRCVKRFFDHWRPDLVLWTESEFWPNLVAEPAARGVPLVLVNGRVSPRSFRNWRRAPSVIGGLLAGFSLCLAQSAEDAERLKSLGAPAVRFVGNLKFAVPPLDADAGQVATLRATLDGRPRWLAASTHPGEEEIVAGVHRRLRVAHPGLVTVIVPRHPDRGAEVARILGGLGLAVARRSQSEAIGAATEVYLADTIGELGLFFRLAEVVFMGKSLVPLGGQNPLEPARIGCAIVHGPNMANFEEIARRLEAAGAAEVVEDADQLAAAVARLLGDEALRRRRIAAARLEASAQEHVIDDVLAELAPFLDRLEEAGRGRA